MPCFLDIGQTPVPKPSRKGRPRRSLWEEIRTGLWYWEVRRASDFPEGKLERLFDERPQDRRGEHGSARWNKYRFGRRSPGRPLVARVGKDFPSSLSVFDHVIWTLLSKYEASASDLWQALRGIPTLATLLTDANPNGGRPPLFWRNNASSHRSVIKALADMEVSRLDEWLDRLTVLLILLHDARLRQREVQHFEVNMAIAHCAPTEMNDRAAMQLKLLSHLLSRFLFAQYNLLSLKALWDEYPAFQLKVPPWTPAQRSLNFSGGRGTSQDEKRLEVAYSALCFLVTRPWLTGLNEDR